MSIQSELHALLSGVLTEGVYALVAPEKNNDLPYITYQRIAGVEDHSLDKNGGQNNLQNTRMQIDVWHTSLREAEVAASKIKVALKAWERSNTKQGEQDFYESSTKAFRIMLDYSIWHI